MKNDRELSRRPVGDLRWAARHPRRRRTPQRILLRILAIIAAAGMAIWATRMASDPLPLANGGDPVERAVESIARKRSEDIAVDDYLRFAELALQSEALLIALCESHPDLGRRLLMAPRFHDLADARKIIVVALLPRFFPIDVRDALSVMATDSAWSHSADLGCAMADLIIAAAGVNLVQDDSGLEKAVLDIGVWEREHPNENRVRILAGAAACRMMGGSEAALERAKRALLSEDRAERWRACLVTIGSYWNCSKTQPLARPCKSSEWVESRLAGLLVAEGALAELPRWRPQLRPLLERSPRLLRAVEALSAIATRDDNPRVVGVENDVAILIGDGVPDWSQPNDAFQVALEVAVFRRWCSLTGRAAEERQLHRTQIIIESVLGLR